MTRGASVIFAGGGAISAQAARSATREVPIVFSVGIDPVMSGFVTSFNQPGGHMTGVALLSTTLVPKQVETLIAMTPMRINSD